MDIKEVMENEEVIEAAEEIAKASSGRFFKAAAVVGLGVLAGVIVYKYVKPAIAARKKTAGKASEAVEPPVAEKAEETDIKEESTLETTNE